MTTVSRVKREQPIPPLGLLARKRIEDFVKKYSDHLLPGAKVRLLKTRFPWQLKVLSAFEKLFKEDNLFADENIWLEGKRKQLLSITNLAGQLGLAPAFDGKRLCFYEAGRFNFTADERTDALASVTEKKAQATARTQKTIAIFLEQHQGLLLEGGREYLETKHAKWKQRALMGLQKALRGVNDRQAFVSEKGSERLGKIMGYLAQLGLFAVFVNEELRIGVVGRGETKLVSLYEELPEGPLGVRSFGKIQEGDPFRTQAAISPWAEKALVVQEEVDVQVVIDEKEITLEEHFSQFLQERESEIKKPSSIARFVSVPTIFVSGVAVVNFALFLATGHMAFFQGAISCLIVLPLGAGTYISYRRRPFAVRRMDRTFENNIKQLLAGQPTPQQIAQLLMDKCSNSEQGRLISSMGRFFGPGKEVNKALKALPAHEEPKE